MNKLDFTPIPQDITILRGPSWQFDFRLPIEVTNINLNDFTIKAYIWLNNSIIETLSAPTNIVIAANGKSFFVKKEWVNGDGTIIDDLISGTLQMQILVTDANGRDYIPAYFNIHIAEKPTESNERASFDTHYVINVVDGAFYVLGVDSLYNLTVEASEQATTARDQAVVANDAVQEIKQPLLDASAAAVQANEEVQAIKQPLLDAAQDAEQAKIEAEASANDASANRKQIINPKWKGGFIDPNGRGYGLFDQDDNFDAAGVTERLADAIFSKIEEKILELLGFSLVQDANYKFAIIDSLKGVFLGIDKDDNIDAAGVSTRLASAISTGIRSELGIVEFSNSIYVWGVMVKSTQQILLGITYKGKVTADIDAITSLVADVSTIKTNITALQTSINSLIAIKRIVCVGDSLTAGAGGGGTSYPSVIASLATGYTVINAGVGGETVASIAARVGAVPAIITQAFTLPADTSEVQISSASDVKIKNKYNTDIALLRQGSSSSVNPCYIEGIECTLRWTGSTYNDPAGVYTLKRNIASTQATAIKANSMLTFNLSRAYRDSDIFVFFMGQNGGYSTDAELVEYIKACVNYNRRSNYIVVGMHTGTPASRANIENLCFQEFGLKYINNREYISGNALYDLGLTPTSQDLTAMSAGTFPPSLWASTTDSTHGNANFYTAVGRKIYSRMQELGYL